VNATKLKAGIKNIRAELKDYVKKSGLKSLVIGISGGIDSAICVALAEPVCDELGIPLIGRSIPIESNKEDEKQRARAIGSAFHVSFEEVDLTGAYRQFLPAIEHECPLPQGETPSRDVKVRRGNVKARMRMIYLYNLAHVHGGLVLSTDNLTEYNLGFFTKNGDVGDFGMIQNLWKTEVYTMARHLVNEFRAANENSKANALQSCIEIPATDGLGVSNTSLDQIGAKSFDEIDALLQSYAQGHCDDLNNPVIRRHLNTSHKRDFPHNIPRDHIF